MKTPNARPSEAVPRTPRRSVHTAAPEDRERTLNRLQNELVHAYVKLGDAVLRSPKHAGFLSGVPFLIGRIYLEEYEGKLQEKSLPPTSPDTAAWNRFDRPPYRTVIAFDDIPCCDEQQRLVRRGARYFIAERKGGEGQPAMRPVSLAESFQWFLRVYPVTPGSWSNNSAVCDWLRAVMTEAKAPRSRRTLRTTEGRR